MEGYLLRRKKFVPQTSAGPGEWFRPSFPPSFALGLDALFSDLPPYA